ncbi:MAG: N-glycosylase/DNA lyase [Candidatus Kapabacteria bacterium]|nr:N-glycosylase/DNA lyase [Ignavibacteriota bacterium]MCW5883716.1 N-glycosylase/DNA lyase [Candidatus Kapabacteria bacterium]
MQLTEELKQFYEIKKCEIKQRLYEFKNVSPEDYFYELCFCICTPQSKASSALQVQQILMSENFFYKEFDPTPILRESKRYIRFHNTKAARLLSARKFYPKIQEVLNTGLSNIEKRNWLADNFNGFGYKESAHFLRNIGYENLGILDRHILRHLVSCGVFEEIPKIGTKNGYLKVEKEFLNFADFIGIPMDELDLLFWAFSTGEIIK